MDDTFLVFNNRNDMSLFFNWINTQHPNIKFTKEKESNNELCFLDVLVCRKDNGDIFTNFYRKPTFSGLYISWDSFLPLAYKKSLVNSFVYRAWRIFSSYELFHSELNFLRTVLAANSYPRTFVETIIRNFLDKQFSTSLPVFGPHKKKVFLSLPFIGDVTCLKCSRQMNRLLGKTVPWLSLRIIFKPARKLSCLSKIKSQFATLTNSGVVYKVSCHDCDAFYIGETKRLLQRRLKDYILHCGNIL